MTKINKLNGVQNVHTQRINELSKKEKPQINTFEIKDLKNMASEALGRSQVTAQVDNHENTTSMVNPEKMMSAMNDYASMSRNMFVLSQKLSSACSRVNARSARYVTSPTSLQNLAA